MIEPNWWNSVRYRVYAPVYDAVARPLERGRERAIERLDPSADDRVLLLGCGTGKDLEYLPGDAAVTAVDITPAMIRRTERRAEDLGMDVDARVGDAGSLPFADDSFDAVLLHLVLSVVPDPEAVVDETERVLADGGRASVYDKFVEGTPSLPRRLVNPLARALFADLNRGLDPMFEGTEFEFAPRETFVAGIYSVTVAELDGA